MENNEKKKWTTLDPDTLENIRQDHAKEDWAKKLEDMDWRDEHPLR